MDSFETCQQMSTLVSEMGLQHVSYVVLANMLVLERASCLGSLFYSQQVGCVTDDVKRALLCTPSL